MKLAKKQLLIIPLLILFQPSAVAQESDVEGSADHPLLSRMENFYITGYEQYQYESHEFYDAEDNEYVVEGRKWVIEYTLKTGFGVPGQLKVRKNYIDAITRMGGTILFDKGLYMKVTQGKKETWIEVWASDDGSDYTLTLVEKAALQKEVVTSHGASAKGTPKSPVTRPKDPSTQKKEEEKNPEIRQIEEALAVAKENRDKTMANLRDIVQKVRSGLAMTFPDVALTPSTPAGPVPIPYPNTGLATDTSKGPKKVKISDKAVTLKHQSNFNKTEGDEVGRKTQTLIKLIQRRYEKGTIRKTDKVEWKDKLLSYQDQAASIARACQGYVQEIERLLAESKKELGLRQAR